MIAMKISKFCK